LKLGCYFRKSLDESQTYDDEEEYGIGTTQSAGNEDGNRSYSRDDLLERLFQKIIPAVDS
jgi:hypothetical protein